MRTVHTIILRLLVDTEQPQSLRGTLNAVSDSHFHSFMDEKSLLAQLHHILGTQDAFADQPEVQNHAPKGNHHS